MKHGTQILATAAVCALTASAFAAGNQDGFLRQQAYAEMQRVTSQIDVVQNNQEDLARRVAKLEKGDSSKAELEQLRAEVANLRALVAELKRQMDAQRGEIVNDLTRRITKAQQQSAPVSRAEPKSIGPHKEYTVQPGDTLSLIAEAFGTSVRKLTEMNPKVKPSALQVGQKINVPVK